MDIEMGMDKEMENEDIRQDTSPWNCAVPGSTGVGTKLNLYKNPPVLSFDLLEKTGIVRHGFSTRYGGVSEGIYASMNLSFKRGDDPECVSENFRRMAQTLGVSADDMVLSDQTHTANVRRITLQDKGMGITRPQSFHDVDGMVTDTPGIMLVTSHADCVPLFFVDPVRKAIGLSHSGWKGTALKIGSVTIRKMGELFGSRPEDILSVIGPCICRSCYEIGEDVALQFRDAFTAGQAEKILTEKGNGKYLLDLKEANRLILKESGLTDSHIYVSDICTACARDLLWSHRKTKGQRGGMAAFLALL